MTNPYSPPKAPVDDPPSLHLYTEQYKREKAAIRPVGVVVVVVLYVVFSMLRAAFFLLDRDGWAIGHLALSALIAYLFRKLWWGSDKERKVAVFIGFLVAAIGYLGSPDGHIQSWSTNDWVSLAECAYFFLSACYLIYARKDQFFSGQKAL